MSNFQPIPVRRFTPQPGLEELVNAMRRLLNKVGVYQPEPVFEADDVPPVQSEWTLFNMNPKDVRDPAGLRAMFHYRRPEVCGIEVYDLSDVTSGSWRRPWGGGVERNARDAGIRDGGVTVLDSVLRPLMAPPFESRIAEYKRLSQEKLNTPHDRRDTHAYEAIVVRLNVLWGEMNLAERELARKS